MLNETSFTCVVLLPKLQKFLRLSRCDMQYMQNDVLEG